MRLDWRQELALEGRKNRGRSSNRKGSGYVRLRVCLAWHKIRGAWGNSAAHVQSTATWRPRPQAVRARDASPLPFRLSARPSPGAPWARGLLSAFWERGSPDLPACGLRRGSKGAQHGPSSSTQAQDPHEGPSLTGRTTRSFLRHGLVRLAHGEAESSRRGTSRGAHDASHDDRDQVGARRAPACAVSLFPLRSKGASTG